MKVCVVIPTYNENASIRRTLERLLANGPDYHVLVVDDNSPDDTAAVVAAYARTEPRVHLLVRMDDRGFGTAVRDGFLQALAQGADFIGQLDADGSHDPAEFPKMRALLESGRADVVIGSRYVRGSKILGWGPMRYINSHVANRLARLVTGVPANDATNGLRLFRRQVLETLPLTALLSRGYSVILETNYRAHRAGFRIAELPITFHPREAGTSKMGLREIVRFVQFLVRLRFHKIPATPAPTSTRRAA
ncbi:MAG TPA: polyprenol monophosphomannose synthase [Gemmataceae bacterium]|jgi:dolichol-phosphate mannosyltransferase|nr:polyprenol monophosphomannose synthase [Gemmataceae bacterium]